MAINLLDGAKGDDISVSKESRLLSGMVKDPNLSLIDRIESFEDIISLEVGDSTLSRARSIERESGIRQLYLKFEGSNPSGTQKDRIAFAQTHDALRRGFSAISLATCGNYGAAVSLAAGLAGLHCVVFIPESYHTERIAEITNNGAEIVRHPGSYEETVSHSSREAEKNEWYDANPGGLNTPLQILAYSEIADEIYDQLRDAPRMVAVPVSNGTLMAGIFRGFVRLYKRGKTSRIPRMLAASSSYKNPIISSFNKGLLHCEDLRPERIRETKTNEPLINWHSFDGEEALYALRQSKGVAFHISDRKMIKMSRMLSEKEGMNVLPASTAGLVGLLEFSSQQEAEADRYVAILTAKK
ncbi:MAG: pyridoxal-phosphate dependent enzyme [Saprospiraceae bacterium]|nr:pyridoxal-phosphate dependent enzyme [Saprospiraceae bacterium]